jgi:hypothetical protein
MAMMLDLTHTTLRGSGRLILEAWLRSSTRENEMEGKVLQYFCFVFACPLQKAAHCTFLKPCSVLLLALL